MKELEAQHNAERIESQKQFIEYKAALESKEKELQENHRKKVGDMKIEVMDIKKGFEARVTEFKKQLDEFKKNNEAIEALKKAHAKELANHV